MRPPRAALAIARTDERNIALRHRYFAGLCRSIVLAALGMAVAPQAHASYRGALALEAEAAHNSPTKRYVVSDPGALLAIARHNLRFRLPNSDPTSSAPYQYGFFDCQWSKQRILAYATAGGYSMAGSDPAAHGLDWGGDALPFLSMLLLRSGCVDARETLGLIRK
jgi:hypothetical protein